MLVSVDVGVASSAAAEIPRWAILQRRAIEQLSASAQQYVEAITEPDGTLIWDERDSPWRDVHGRTRKDAQGRDMQWPGIDGSDDGYEAFANLALLYCLGGEEELDAVSRRQWEAVTRQFTEFGTVHDEFDGAYDWMHHGESSQILYFLGLANPHDAADRRRSLKFSELYIDEAAGNWNAKLKMIKSPLNGSRGALTTTTEIDWCTHRDNLSDYLCPFEDHPALAVLPPSRPRNSVAPDGEAWDVSLDWNDDAIMDGIIEQFNARQTSGDVPLNLLATSLVTHAFLLDPPDKAEHKAWVLEYLGAWEDRAAANAGILPDNIGETGVAGEHMGGKWWGGYYGYRWPHGVFNLLESILVAGCNAYLLSHGDSNAFTLYRQQCDLLWSLGLEGADDGIFRIPARHSDAGWCDYREPKEIQGFDRNLVLLYHCTQRVDDLQRLTRLPGAREGWPLDSQNMGKGGTYPATSWHAYVTGKGNTEYPLDVLEATLDENERRVQQLKDDDGRTSHVTQWASLCPVCPHGLLQLICGTPGAVYHGGLVHARLMPFDPVAKRPGLPPCVALLVHTVQLGRVVCSVVNTDAQSERILILQAGAFAEHTFTTAQLSSEGRSLSINGQHLQLRLAPQSQVEIEFGMELHTAAEPSYARPWDLNLHGSATSSTTGKSSVSSTSSTNEGSNASARM